VHLPIHSRPGDHRLVPALASGPVSGPPATASMTVRVDRVDGEDGFRTLASEWDALLDACGTRNVFLSWDWVSLWWAIYGRADRLHLLLARDGDDRLIGIAPLKKRRLSLCGIGFGEVVEFIGAGSDVTPERLDFIIRPGLEAAVSAAMIEALYQDPSVAGIDLKPLAATSPVRAHLQAALGDRGRHPVGETPHSVCPVLTLPATWEAFQHGRSKNYRKKMGEYQRRCVRDHAATVRWSTTPAELSRDMAVLIELHARRWNGSSRAFCTPEYIDFHRRFAERLLAAGRLRLFVMESGDGPLAALYCFAHSGRYYFYQSGRDPDRSRHRPGLVLMHAAIQQAIAEGIEVFDFLRGGEAYKYIWAGEEQASVHLQHWRTGPAHLVAHGRSLLRRARRAFAAAPVTAGPGDSGGSL
jgi:CelD/BcsL family acetyltransferase involved in cellulose biosynthesis